MCLLKSWTVNKPAPTFSKIQWKSLLSCTGNVKSQSENHRLQSLEWGIKWNISFFNFVSFFKKRAIHFWLQQHFYSECYHSYHKGGTDVISAHDCKAIQHAHIDWVNTELLSLNAISEPGPLRNPLLTPTVFHDACNPECLKWSIQVQRREGFRNLVWDDEHLSIGLVNYHTSPHKQNRSLIFLHEPLSSF